jgi:hypothetical protein
MQWFHRIGGMCPFHLLIAPQISLVSWIKPHPTLNHILIPRLSRLWAVQLHKLQHGRKKKYGGGRPASWRRAGIGLAVASSSAQLAAAPLASIGA